MNDIVCLSLLCATLVLLGMCGVIFSLSRELANTNRALLASHARDSDTIVSINEDARTLVRARFEADANVKLPAAPSDPRMPVYRNQPPDPFNPDVPNNGTNPLGL